MFSKSSDDYNDDDDDTNDDHKDDDDDDDSCQKDRNGKSAVTSTAEAKKQHSSKAAGARCTELRNRFSSLPADQCVSQAPAVRLLSSLLPATSSSSSPNDQSDHQQISKKPQRFSLILVIDFECTCEKDVASYPHEIIEFPVVAVDVASRQTVAEFHSFVRPVINPILSAFCTELTGITQAQADAAPTLPEVLVKFTAWLHALCAARKEASQISCSNDNKDNHNNGSNASLPAGTSSSASNNNSSGAQKKQQQLQAGLPGRCGFPEHVVMANDGPWDMRSFIFNHHMRRDGTAFPAVLLSFINVRNEYAAHFKVKPMCLAKALARQKLEFRGHQHSGIDDSRNIARLVVLLLQRGHVFGPPCRIYGPAEDFRLIKEAMTALQKSCGFSSTAAAPAAAAAVSAHNNGNNSAVAVTPLMRSLRGTLALEQDGAMVMAELGFQAKEQAVQRLADEIDHGGKRNEAKAKR